MNLTHTDYEYYAQQMNGCSASNMNTNSQRVLIGRIYQRGMCDNSAYKKQLAEYNQLRTTHETLMGLYQQATSKKLQRAYKVKVLAALALILPALATLAALFHK